MYHHLFATSYKDLKKVTLEEHKIELLSNAKPLQQRPGKINHNYVQIVKEELDKLLDARFIILMKNPKWVSPLTINIKRMGSYKYVWTTENLIFTSTNITTHFLSLMTFWMKSLTMNYIALGMAIMVITKSRSWRKTSWKKHSPFHGVHLFI